MADRVPLLAELLHNAGYFTGCVQSNWTLKDRISGLARGFDVYEDDFHKRRWGFMLAERTGDGVTEVALDLLKKCEPGKPFFLWVHYSDPHAPYKFHRECNPAGKKMWLLGTKDRVQSKYDSEIAWMDREMARFLAALPADTVVLFAADHGESLYEHDYLGHGRRMYQDNLHVPLMLRAPGLSPGRSRVPATMLDVAPTLLALAGIAPAKGMLGVNLLDPNAVPASRVRYVETYGGAVPRLPGVKSLLADRRPMRQGVLVDHWKLIIGGEGPELYNLAEDPGELKNLASEQPKRFHEMMRLVQIWDKEHIRGQVEEASLTRDDFRALESLGYLQ